MAILPKNEFTRLVTGLTDEQYRRMLDALARADVDLPGWRDRSQTSPERLRPGDPISVQLPYAGWRRGLELAHRVAARGSEVWIVADAASVSVVGSDNRGAAQTSIAATVVAAGAVVVDAREAFLITEALAKGVTAAARRSATISLHGEDHAHIRLSMNGRSHRAGLRERGDAPPALPPVAGRDVVLPDAGALRRAIQYVWPASESRRSDDVLRLDRIGVRASDGVLTLDATDRYRAAEASLPAVHEHAFEAFVDAAWLREASNALTHGQAWIGLAQEHGSSVMMIAGEEWNAWTTSVGAWRPRYRPRPQLGRVGASVARNDLVRFLRDAHRLTTAGVRGPSDGSVRATIEPGALRMSGLGDEAGGAHIGSVQLPADTSDLSDTAVAYLDIRQMLDALRGFTGELVTMHLGADRMVHVTLPGSAPDERPALMWSIVGLRPPGEPQS